MYSERLRELFHSRAHAGKLDDATHYGEAGTPEQKPYTQLWSRIQNGIVQAAGIKASRRLAEIVCALVAAAWSVEQVDDRLDQVTPVNISDWVDGVPEGKDQLPEPVAFASL